MFAVHADVAAGRIRRCVIAALTQTFAGADSRLLLPAHPLPVRLPCHYRLDLRSSDHASVRRNRANPVPVEGCQFVKFPRLPAHLVLTLALPTATVARVGVDQFVLTPCVLTLFFTCQSLLEGKGFSEARNRIENKWWPTIQKNWGVRQGVLLSTERQILTDAAPADLDSCPAHQLLCCPAASATLGRQRWVLGSLLACLRVLTSRSRWQLFRSSGSAHPLDSPPTTKPLTLVLSQRLPLVCERSGCTEGPRQGDHGRGRIDVEAIDIEAMRCVTTMRWMREVCEGCYRSSSRPPRTFPLLLQPPQPPWPAPPPEPAPS